MEDPIYISSDDDDEWNYNNGDDDDDDNDDDDEWNNSNDADDDDGEFLDGFSGVEEEGNGNCQKGPSCKVIREDSLLAAQQEDLQRVMDLLSLKEHHARSLLIHYRWEADKVLAVLVERGRETLFAEAGVTLEGKDEHTSTPSTADEVTCQICFEDIPVEKTTVMDCNHRFCNDCWTTHFIVQINEGKSKRVTCMASKCNVVCDEGKIRDLVTAKDPTLAEKFDRFLLESYIDDNKRVKWCPSVPHCGNAIRIEDDEYCCEVECACGVQFCFNCLSEAHSPCSCLMWKHWMTKCKNDGKTVTWISENAKHCPKCHNAVEKNGGCNLVRCRCGQPFCWLCGGATGLEHTWSSIRGHTCGSYKEGEQEKTPTVRNDLLRYTHHYERYMVHRESLKLEANMKQKLHEEVLKLEARELQSKDFSWAEDGLYRLLQSRRILSCSYPLSFYVFGQAVFKNEMTPKEREIKQNLFENLQQQLEINVERLSMFLEEPFAEYPEDKVLETRMKVITLSTVTDNLCKKLCDCIDNELLVTMQQVTHSIAHYRSDGVAKASELPN